MKTTITLMLLATMTVAVSASPVIKNYYTVVLDENGHGFISQSVGNQVLSVQQLSASTNFSDPFAVAHPDAAAIPNPKTLSYALPAALLQGDFARLTFGDIIINEPGGGSGQHSDLIRISSDGRIYTYSFLDSLGSGLSLADVGVPLNVQTISTSLTEGSLAGLSTLGVNIPGGSTGCYYLPTAGQVGSVTNGIVSFYFISDGITPKVTAQAATSVVPEPTTVVAGALMLVPLGVSMLRRLRKS